MKRDRLSPAEHIPQACGPSREELLMWGGKDTTTWDVFFPRKLNVFSLYS